MKASDMRNGQYATIRHIHLSVKDKKRLFYLGIYEGGELMLLQRAPLHDPLLFFAQGNQIILRKQDATCIDVEVIG